MTRTQLSTLLNAHAPGGSTAFFFPRSVLALLLALAMTAVQVTGVPTLAAPTSFANPAALVAFLTALAPGNGYKLFLRPAMIKLLTKLVLRYAVLPGQVVGPWRIGAVGDSLLTRYRLEGEKSSLELVDDQLPRSQFALINSAAVPNSLLSNVAAQLATLLSTNPPTNFDRAQVLHASGINNLDAGNASVDAVITGIQTNVQSLRAAGYTKILVSTITAFNPASYQPAALRDFHKRRREINARIIAEIAALDGVAAIVNPGQDMLLGSDTAGLNTMYFTDTVHYALPGRQRMADKFYAPAMKRVADGERGFVQSESVDITYYETWSLTYASQMDDGTTFGGTKGNVTYAKPFAGNRLRVSFFRDGVAGGVDVKIGGQLVGHYDCSIAAGPAYDSIECVIPAGQHAGFVLEKTGGPDLYHYLVGVEIYWA